MFIGLMSGTSIDGIDAVLVDFSNEKPVLVETHHQPYTPELRKQIMALCSPSADEINRLGEMDILLGKEFANAVNTLLEKHPAARAQVRAIGSHGQTIRHHPQRGFTLQIGDPNVIAAETQITTVADFRRRDMALGGQGAPLVPAFHHAIFATPQVNRVIVNIGGIANITLLSADGKVSGFDTGPGNTLLDAWTEKHLQKTYDQHGEWARTGTVQKKLLQTLLSDAFFHLPAPKSTGREYFNLMWLEQFLTDEKPADVQATLVDLTARSIAQSIQSHFSEGKVFVCGGGAHNQFLLQRLEYFLPEFSLASTEKLGVHPNWVEAMAFAWLAKQTLEKKASNLTSVTGANQASILGGVYFA